ncbi:MAG TPA: M20/M25/M40 family metallo-hydrolase [Blastocatellia bacterium]|nr:M20/M25/M40 family metallo-hydrolase [Blastocatellia bacterium]
MIRRHTSLILLLSMLGLVVAPVSAGKARQENHEAEKVDLAAIQKIKDEALKHSQVMDILSYLSDVYGPRLTGSPNVRAAQEWTEARLKSWGVDNVHLESWGPFGRGWSLSGFSADVVSPQYIPLIAYPKAWSPSTNGTVKGEPVYLDAKTEADLAKYQGKLHNAIVLISPPAAIKAHWDPQATRQSDEHLLELANSSPPAEGRGPRFPPPTAEQKAARELELAKWRMCYSEGAALVLDAARGDGGTIFVQQVTIPAPLDTPFDKRPRPWAQDAPAIVPQVAVAAEHYDRMIRMIERGVHLTLAINISSRYYDDNPMSDNLIAEIPGTDLKDQVVMLGGHFDSWHSATGATDNGAGSAVAIEAIRILKTLGLQPRRTIRLALWTGEEEGLLGSRAYVEQHFGRRILASGESFFSNQPSATPPKFELKPEQATVSAYFNLDNGSGKIRGVYMQGNEAVRPIFREWLEPFKDMGASTLSMANTGGTDHLSFDAVGIPGFQFIQDPLEYGTRTHHSNMDLYDRAQEEDLEQAAAIMASFVYNAAMRSGKLPRKPLPGQAGSVAAR